MGNPHLNGELLQSLAGITMVHVPYKGASGQLADVASGNRHDLRQLRGRRALQGGRVKALAVTSATRASFAKDIPAIAETPGLSAYALENWFGLYAPARTPPAVVQRVYEAVRDALADPALAQRLREQGGEPAPLPPAEFAAFIASERASSTPPSSSAPTSRRTSEEAAMNTDPAGHVAQDWENTHT